MAVGFRVMFAKAGQFLARKSVKRTSISGAIFLTVFVGGGIVLVYALSVIIPFRTMIQDVMSNWS